MDERNKYIALQHWFQTPQGQGVAQAFTAELSISQSNLRGKYLLQLGDCGDNPWLNDLSYSCKWFLSPALGAGGSINASISAIPIERESIDCIVAPLTMEASAQGKNPIDEIDRILKSMGYVIFLGINPWSFWGASLRWGRLSCFAHASASLSSSLSLKHALLSRGYQQCWLSSFYYIPPINHKTWIHKLAFLNQMGKMVWPYPAGFYCLIMQKNAHCMTAVSCTSRDQFYLAQT
ncbi:MAG: methyltransferase [Legionella sp.]|nr:MAG: methyltransferase [Legionella sp.]